MTPFFGKPKKVEEDVVKQKIMKILEEESILKENEYKDGKIVLTEHNLLWLKKEKVDSAIIPLGSIRKVQKATKLGLGPCLKVVYEENGKEKEAYFPFRSAGRLSAPKLDDIEGWVVTLQTGVPSRVFSDIVYVGGHSAYPEKRNGRLILTSTNLIFEESKDKGLRLEIPLKKIEKISIQKASEISRLTTILAGPLWSMGFPMKSKFVMVEYTDEIGMKQTPLFDFPLDRGDKKKGEVMRAVYEQLKKIKA